MTATTPLSTLYDQPIRRGTTTVTFYTRDGTYPSFRVERPGVAPRGYGMAPIITTVEAAIPYLRARGYKSNRPFRGSEGWTIPDAHNYDHAADALEALLTAETPPPNGETLVHGDSLHENVLESLASDAVRALHCCAEGDKTRAVQILERAIIPLVEKHGGPHWLDTRARLADLNRPSPMSLIHAVVDPRPESTLGDILTSQSPTDFLHWCIGIGTAGPDWTRGLTLYADRAEAEADAHERLARANTGRCSP